MKTLMYERLTNLYPLFRESLEERKGAEKDEAEFILGVVGTFRGKVKTIIDLGGGVGMHSKILATQGYDVTVFDQSKKALLQAKKGYIQLKTAQGTFETIALQKSYDAAICMWSTFPYILNAKGRKHFFHWLKSHIKQVIILEEANFYRYITMREFHKTYAPVNNKQYQLKVTRDWIINQNRIRESSYVYTITNKKTGERRIIQDTEMQQYLTVKEVKMFLGKRWKLKKLLGDFSVHKKFDQNRSSRCIMIFGNF